MSFFCAPPALPAQSGIILYGRDDPAITCAQSARPPLRKTAFCLGLRQGVAPLASTGGSDAAPGNSLPAFTGILL